MTTTVNGSVVNRNLLSQSGEERLEEKKWQNTAFENPLFVSTKFPQGYDWLQGNGDTFFRVHINTQDGVIKKVFFKNEGKDKQVPSDNKSEVPQNEITNKDLKNKNIQVLSVKKSRVPLVKSNLGSSLKDMQVSSPPRSVVPPVNKTLVPVVETPIQAVNKTKAQTYSSSKVIYKFEEEDKTRRCTEGWDTANISYHDQTTDIFYFFLRYSIFSDSKSLFSFNPTASDDNSIQPVNLGPKKESIQQNLEIATTEPPITKKTKKFFSLRSKDKQTLLNDPYKDRLTDRFTEVEIIAHRVISVASNFIKNKSESGAKNDFGIITIYDLHQPEGDRMVVQHVLPNIKARLIWKVVKETIFACEEGNPPTRYYQFSIDPLSSEKPKGVQFNE